MAVGPVGLSSKSWVPPVGFIMSTGSPTSPAAHYANTSWTQIKNYFIIGAGGNYSLGSTGGSTSHTLTIAEMPAHSHSGSITAVGDHTHTLTAYTGSGSYLDYRDGISPYYIGERAYTTSTAGAHTHTVSVGYSGGGSSFSILNPYVGKYVWRRIS